MSEESERWMANAISGFRPMIAYPANPVNHV